MIKCRVTPESYRGGGRWSSLINEVNEALSCSLPADLRFYVWELKAAVKTPIMPLCPVGAAATEILTSKKRAKTLRAELEIWCSVWILFGVMKRLQSDLPLAGRYIMEQLSKTSSAALIRTNAEFY